MAPKERRFATWNIRGLQSSLGDVQTWMAEKDIDWVVVTETWLGHVAGGSTKPWESDKSVCSLVSKTKKNGVAGRYHGGIALVANQAAIGRRQISLIDACTDANWALWKVDNVFVLGFYFGVSLTLPEVSTALDAISASFDQIPQEADLVVMGDANALFKHSDGTFEDDARGSKFREWMEDNGLKLLEPEEGKSFNTTIGSSVGSRWRDLMLVNANLLPKCTKLTIDNEQDWQSDHYPVMLELEPAVMTAPAKIQKRLGWKFSMLNDENIRINYLERMQHSLQPFWEKLRAIDSGTGDRSFLVRQDLCNQVHKLLINGLKSCADTVLPKLKEWDGSERRCKSAEVLRLKAKIKEIKVSPPTAIFSRESKQTLLKELKQALKNAMKKETNERWHDSYIGELEQVSVSECLSVLKKVRRGRQRGTSPKATQESIEAIANHFEAQFQPCVTGGVGQSPRQLSPTEPFFEPVKLDPVQFDLSQSLFEQMSSFAVAKAVRNTAFGKAAGPDMISKEWIGLRRCGKSKPMRADQLSIEDSNNPVIAAFSAFYRLVLRFGVAPQDWSLAVVTPLYKGKGSRADLCNWRPIALLSYIRKVFEKLCQHEITGAGFNAAQGGFQPNKSTLDQVAALNHQLHIAKRSKKPVYVVFLDIQAAYDTVDRQLLTQRLLERNTDSRLTHILANMTSESTFFVAADGIQSKSKTTRSGVPQGSSLSPQLYNSFIDVLFDRLKIFGESVVGLEKLVEDAQGHIIPSFGFADDIALVTTDLETLRRFLSICEEFSVASRFRWKPSKCKVISSERVNISLYSQDIEQVEEFTYLGVPFGVSGILVDRLISHNISKTIGSAANIAALGINGYGLAPGRVITAWKAFVRSTLEYGLAVCPLSKSHVKRLDKAQASTLRKCLGAYRNTSIEAMKRLANADGYEIRSEWLQVKFAKKLFSAPRSSLVPVWINDACNDSTSPTRSILDGNSIWKRKFMEWECPSIGIQLRSLWTAKENAAVQFGSVLNRPWKAHPRGSGAGMENIIGKKLTKLDLVKVRRHKEMLDLGKWENNDSNRVVRDIPLIKNTKSVLNLFGQTSKSERRTLVGWFLGSFPRRTDTDCGLCGHVGMSKIKREHLGRCGARKCLIEVNHEDVRGMYSDGSFDLRASKDDLTAFIWKTCAQKGPNIEDWSLIHKCLKVITEDALKRQPELVGTG